MLTNTVKSADRFRKILSLAAVVLVVLAAMMMMMTRAPSAQGTGVYTAAQAAAGAKLYVPECAMCHGQSLEGLSGPALEGKAFLDKWNGQSADDLHYIMSTQMPQSAPGSLKPDEYIDLVAFVLQQNKFPAGSEPLTAAKLKRVKITTQGP